MSRFTVFSVRFIPLAFAISALSLASFGAIPAHAQQAYGRGETVLVTPDGDILDYIPERGSVTFRRDAYGRRVLVDRDGTVIATEMPASRVDGGNYASRDRGFGMDAAPWDPNYDENRRYNGGPGDDNYATGTIPRGRFGDDADVMRQPLPDNPADTANGNPSPAPRQPAGNFNNIPDDTQTASIGPNDTPTNDLPEALESPAPKLNLTGKSRAEIAALQVYLDRSGMSPGAIDGKKGSNLDKALHTYEMATGDKLDPRNSEEIMNRLAAGGGLPFMDYTITSSDAAGPYVASIPTDYAQKAAMPSMGYTSVTEMLAERFHMDENYLKELNPGVDFNIPGTIVKVANPGPPITGQVTRIIANKAIKQVQAFDAKGNLIAAFPASIGSADTPSPSGTHAVARIAFNPNYTYNPKINFKQGNNDKVLTIPPGPNGPVGNVWIALDKPTYGIHGTPDPSMIGKTQSHGCVRLTNWDAQELAKMVKPGTIVQFVD
ncbi:L,D-transpeptidase [Rhizobium sp. C1]|uniref:L,D-transpeptidase n=1 Tax=Rhizobium sp. C1 TaxID=1349799 RepID=UPI0022A95387